MDKIKIFFKTYKTIIFLIIFTLIINIQLPYRVYMPGGLINVDSRLIGEKEKSKGSFNLTYVSSVNGKIPVIIGSFFNKNWDLIKDEDIVLTNETIREYEKRGKIDKEQSISNATYIAYTKANEKFEILKSDQYIYYLYDFSNTTLKVGDKILKINNKEIKNSKDILNIIENSKIHDKLNLIVLRDNKELECSAEVLEQEGKKIVGMIVTTINEYKLDKEIKYTTKNSEAGSSGGLMLSLAIYNALTKNDITKGLIIAGTGTIDADGNVGEIDGIKYKLIGAAKNNASIFIVPKDNYQEAKKIKEKYKLNIELIKAENFDQVLEDLKNIK